MNSFLWLIPVLPLAGFAANFFFRLPRSLAPLIGCAVPIASFGLSVAAFAELPLRQSCFQWITVGTLAIPFGLQVDGLTGVMILVVTGVGSLIHVYSVAYMRDDEGQPRFFAYLNLFMFSMLMLVMGDSLPLMFLGWEGVGLCSYLLIGFWYKDLKNADAGKKAFIVNRIGDFGFLIGIFLIWDLFGSLDFARLSAASTPADPRVWWAAAFLFLGACGKSAQIPLYVWLPDAMAGPTPVSALIHAATMVTAGVYMVARMHLLYAASGFLETVGWIGASTALLGGVIAVAQTDIKKVLAYSTISQLGFMFAGLATGEFGTGIFHVVTHAFFKALLFLGAGAVIHALHGEQDIRKMGGLFRRMPLLGTLFICGGLALSGMPLTAGYVSKDAILAAAYLHLPGPVWAMLVATALLTAFYTTRLIVIVFLGEGHEHHDLHKPGLLMTVPLMILALLSLAGGLVLEGPLHGILHFGIVNDPVGVDHHGAHALNQKISMAVFTIGFVAAMGVYLVGRDRLKAWVEGAGRQIHALVYYKFYVDEIYQLLIVAPVTMGATVAWFLVDRLLIDGLLVNGAGRLMYAVGGVLRKPHTGSLNVGLVSLALGAVAALAWVLFAFTLWKT